MNEQSDYMQPVEYNVEGFTANTEPTPKKNGYATAALVLGIIATVLGCCCYCCFMVIPILSILAIVFAVLSKKNSDGVMSGKAKAGMILGIIALVLFVVYLIIYGVFVSAPDLFSEFLDPIFQEEYGMTFEEYLNYVENMDELDTLPLPKSEIPVS